MFDYRCVERTRGDSGRFFEVCSHLMWGSAQEMFASSGRQLLELGSAHGHDVVSVDFWT